MNTRYVIALSAVALALAFVGPSAMAQARGWSTPQDSDPACEFARSIERHLRDLNRNSPYTQPVRPQLRRAIDRLRSVRERHCPDTPRDRSDGSRRDGHRRGR